ncbi:MAG: 50S ribosomal protein L6 [Nanoarchaeota archaeon]|nr:50S ribosomal protein L6 [Nanoarchaeota archaeon]MBU1644475.1 50S ribosomal protein L6 [Nanoarchaeota archaeon]MBU1976479.1 50S ribosomal protein L6 [Nanoarchaeota archaeon]
MRLEIELKKGVTAQVEGSLLKVKGPKGEINRGFLHPKVFVLVEGSKIVLVVKQATKREKTVIGTFESHVKNMVKGVEEPFEYKLKICSGHFPMNVSVSGSELTIKNFLGESVPRKVKLMEGVIVKINGTEIVVTSPNKELAGQAAAQIESLCRITNRDRRIFQDGCYITDKAGKRI